MTALDDTWRPELGDEQVEFFLKHQQQLVEWSTFGARAYRQLRKVVADIEFEAPAGWKTGRGIAQRDKQGLFLFKDEWCLSDRRAPDVAIVLSCDFADRTDPAGLDAAAGKPFVGLLCGASEEGKRIEEGLRADQHRLEGWRAGVEHVAYRYMADPDWYSHPATWRAALLAELESGRTHYEAVIDQAIATLPDRPPAP